MATNDNIIGNVGLPSFLKGGYGNVQATGGQGGLPLFISNIVKLLTVVAGLWVLVNFILAGLQFISSQGDEKAVASAWNKIYNSIIGLVIIAVAFGLISLISLILTGYAGTFLNITIYGPEG